MSLVSPLRWALLSFTTGEKVSVVHSLSFTRFRNFYKSGAGGNTMFYYNWPPGYLLFKINLRLRISSVLEKSNSNKEASYLIIAPYHSFLLRHKNYVLIETAWKNYWRFSCAQYVHWFKKQIKHRKQKWRIRKKPKFSALHLRPPGWGNRNMHWKPVIMIPGFSRKKIGKIIPCKYTTTITVLFFPQSIIKTKQNKEQFFFQKQTARLKIIWHKRFYQ